MKLFRNAEKIIADYKNKNKLIEIKVILHTKPFFSLSNCSIHNGIRVRTLSFIYVEVVISLDLDFNIAGKFAFPVKDFQPIFKFSADK